MFLIAGVLREATIHVLGQPFFECSWKFYVHVKVIAACGGFVVFCAVTFVIINEMQKI